jgi:hypothetical protein
MGVPQQLQLIRNRRQSEEFILTRQGPGKSRPVQTTPCCEKRLKLLTTKHWSKKHMISERWFLLLYILGTSESSFQHQNIPILPYGWKSSVDDNGRTYYFNTETKQTTWSLPDRRTLIFDLFPVTAPASDNEGGLLAKCIIFISKAC